MADRLRRAEFDAVVRGRTIVPELELPGRYASRSTPATRHSPIKYLPRPRRSLFARL